MKDLYRIDFLRRIILPILFKLKLHDITIRHHWTDDKFTLHPVKNKDYWYHGKKRENKSMQLFSNLIGKGDYVIDIGGHIGYISLYFAKLVGHEGRVIVFEPGPNNLPYIRRNTKANPSISIVDKAVTDYTGTAKFFIENLTGQNNSLLEEYGVLKENIANMHINSIKKNIVEVSCITLDDFLHQTQVPAPSFIKIDIEGAELKALNGMKNTIEKNDIVLILEVKDDAENIFQLLKDAGFKMFNPDKIPIHDSKDMKGHIFCVKETDDRIRIFSSKFDEAS